MLPSKLKPFDSEIIKAYLSGLSSEEIGKRYGTHDSSIDYRLKINGIKKRSISESLRGKVKTIIWKQRISESRIKYGVARGKKNPNWKGGIQDNWSELKNSLEYKKWRNDVFSRDNYTCRMCGDNKGHNLHAHHIYPRRDYPEKKLFVNNGITLCKECHKKTIYKEYNFIALFEKMSNSVKPISSVFQEDVVIPSQAS